MESSEKILNLLNVHKDSLGEEASLFLKLAAAHVRKSLKQKEVNVERSRIQSFELALEAKLGELDAIQREIEDLKKKVGCEAPV